MSYRSILTNVSSASTTGNSKHSLVFLAQLVLQ